MKNQERILTVKELNRYIRMKLESDALLQNVWVRGEVSNFTHHSSGHMYFTLKDKDSRLKAVMFSSHNQRLKFIPREGASVLARGNVSIYERDGGYQLYVAEMQPDGIGSLYLAFEQLKSKLEAEGLFASAAKKAIPRFPGTIGVVTSATGAAVRDILITLQRRYPAARIVLYPASVQGERAAASIVRAIGDLNEIGGIDVMIVGRGGGSLEELWPFNEEAVARSIHASGIPVISAVGHETDYTIADFTADLRAATPTAAAELAVPHRLELAQHIAHLQLRLQQGLYRRLLQPSERLDRLKEQLAYKWKARLHGLRRQLGAADRSLASGSPSNRIAAIRRRWQEANRQLTRAARGVHKAQRQALAQHIRQLDALSPLKIMQRGYGLVYEGNHNELVRSVRQIQAGDRLKIQLHDGQIDCLVRSTKGEIAENGTGSGDKL